MDMAVADILRQLPFLSDYLPKDVATLPSAQVLPISSETFTQQPYTPGGAWSASEYHGRITLFSRKQSFIGRVGERFGFCFGWRFLRIFGMSVPRRWYRPSVLSSIGSENISGTLRRVCGKKSSSQLGYALFTQHEVADGAIVTITLRIASAQLAELGWQESTPQKPWP